MDLQRLRPVLRVADDAGVVPDADAGLGQGRAVRGGEGVEGFGAELGGPVAPDQDGVEVDGHFRHHRMAVRVHRRGDFHGRDEVLLAVGAGDADRELASREDDRLPEPLQHEAQGRGRIGHRVGPVQDDEAVVVVVPVADQVREPHPQGRLHVGGVDERVEGVGVDPDGELAQFGDFLGDLAEVEGFQGLVHRVLFHADGAARVDDQDGGCFHSRYRVSALRVVVASTVSRGRSLSSAILAATRGR